MTESSVLRTRVHNNGQLVLNTVWMTVRLIADQRGSTLKEKKYVFRLQEQRHHKFPEMQHNVVWN